MENKKQWKTKNIGRFALLSTTDLKKLTDNSKNKNTSRSKQLGFSLSKMGWTTREENQPRRIQISQKEDLLFTVQSLKTQNKKIEIKNPSYNIFSSIYVFLFDVPKFWYIVLIKLMMLKI